MFLSRKDLSGNLHSISKRGRALIPAQEKFSLLCRIAHAASGGLAGDLSGPARGRFRPVLLRPIVPPACLNPLPAAKIVFF